MEDTCKNGDAAPLKKALDKNVEVTEEVKQAAENLAVVHAVLDKADAAPVEDITRASEHAEKLEKKLSAAAEKLEDVNETLTEELKARGLIGPDLP